MKREKMNGIVNSELHHIPRGLKGSTQNYLRAYYNGQREHDLAQKNPRGQNAILKDVIAQLRESDPDFKPVFKDNFFTK